MSTTAPARSEIDAAIAAVVDEWTPDDDFVVAVVAQKVEAQLRESNPDLLDAWLHAHASIFLGQLINERVRRRRHASLRQAPQRKFAEAADAAENGDTVPLTQFLVDYEIDEDHTRRRVMDMTGADHQFVSDRYQASGSRDLMLSAFHRAVARKVGKKRTADVLSEAQYLDLYRSVVKD